MAIKLKYQGNDNQKGVITLGQKPLIIGRSSSCDVKITDDMVSGKHLAVKTTTIGKVIIKDLGTTNGTTVNGSNIDEHMLMIGDEVQIGEITLMIDEMSLTPQERSVLTKDNKKTQVKFVNLLDPSHKEVPKEKIPEKKPAPKPAPAKIKSAIDEIDQHLDKKPIKEFDPSADLNMDDIDLDKIDINELSEREQTILQEKIKKRVLEKSRHVENMRQKLIDDKITNKVKAIDLEAPTGETEFMKVDKKKKARPKSRDELDKDKTVVHSIAGKLLGLFKKKG
jgi:pSer/pThr/pTyr-binding forkhead associated (FHA) protein